MGWLVVGSTACWVVSKPEKSPPSSPAVGTLLKRVNPLLDRKPSQYPEKYVFESRPLYRPQGVGKITGPPTVRPYWFWRKAGFFCFAKLSSSPHPTCHFAGTPRGRREFHCSPIW